MGLETFKRFFLNSLFCSTGVWLSGLFALRKFCSIAKLNFQCFNCHFCLGCLFDKNMYYENVWDWVFIFF